MTYVLVKGTSLIVLPCHTPHLRHDVKSPDSDVNMRLSIWNQGKIGMTYDYDEREGILGLQLLCSLEPRWARLGRAVSTLHFQVLTSSEH